MSNHPRRFSLHKLLSPEFGFGHDVILRVFNGDGEVEGDLKAHDIIMALGSSVLKEFLFNQSGSWPHGRSLRQARPDIRAFVENHPENARIFVILPGFL